MIGAPFGWEILRTTYVSYVCMYVHTYNYMYDTADREPASVCASGVFVEFLRDDNPRTFTSTMVQGSGLLSESTGHISASSQNTVTDIMPVRKSRFRLEMTMNLEFG